MKKLLVTTFALAIALVANVGQSFASCGCMTKYVAPCAAPCAVQCPAPCAAPCITGFAAPCQTTCGCKSNCGCCCKKRGYFYNLFHDTYKCGCGCDQCNCMPKSDYCGN